MSALLGTGSATRHFSGAAAHILFAGFTLTAVAIAATLGGRQDEGPPPSQFASHLEVAHVRPEGGNGVSGNASDAPGVGDFDGGSRLEVQSMYLVASESDASELRRDLQDANAVRFHAGQVPLSYQVVVTTEDAERFELLYHLYRISIWNLHEGLPAIAVIDLR